MEIDTWWGIIDRARTAVGDRADDRDGADDPLPRALVDVLVGLTPEEIAAFAVTHVEVKDSAYRYPLWNAAYLIEGGCGDDGFTDFRDGLVLLGRDTFTRAVADPDTLADLPVVVRMGTGNKGWIGYEAVGYLVKDAYRAVRGEVDSFDAVVDGALSTTTRSRTPAGERWDPEDEDEARRRLPRLAALFLEG
ncbi:DUF4240 domain-containing protein [Actinosynnema sp. NPDC023587]|uniref:DUF4240 domain-containing protein n=1 Tax=Actinosynnema sp. NPDC023587 TaxID=3154695 RepID=UPI0033CC8B63